MRVPEFPPASRFEEATLLALNANAEPLANEIIDAAVALPQPEYRELHSLRQQTVPLPRTQFWIGRYRGERHLGSSWATPAVVRVPGLPEPELPHAYVMTLVLGEVLLQGIRFTAPGLEVDVRPVQGFAQLWPSVGDASWPIGEKVDDEGIVAVSLGKNLKPVHDGLTLHPWRPATELPESKADGLLVRLPTPCGRHFVCYPAALVEAALRGMFYTFVTSCECEKAYLVATEHDGAHFLMEAEGEGISTLVERYEAAPGDETTLRDLHGQFACKGVPRREAPVDL